MIAKLPKVILDDAKTIGTGRLSESTDGISRLYYEYGLEPSDRFDGRLIQWMVRSKDGEVDKGLIRWTVDEMDGKVGGRSIRWTVD